MDGSFPVSSNNEFVNEKYSDLLFVDDDAPEGVVPNTNKSANNVRKISQTVPNMQDKSSRITTRTVWKRKTRCFYCKQQDHILSECPTAPECSKCGRKGHLDKSCRNQEDGDTKFSWQNASKQEKKEKKNRQDKKKKRKLQDSLDSLEGSAEEILEKIEIPAMDDSDAAKDDAQMEEEESQLFSLTKRWIWPTNQTYFSPSNVLTVASSTLTSFITSVSFKTIAQAIKYVCPLISTSTISTINFGLFSFPIITAFCAYFLIRNPALHFQFAQCLYRFLPSLLTTKRTITRVLALTHEPEEEIEDRRTDVEKLQEHKHDVKAIYAQMTWQSYDAESLETPDDSIPINTTHKHVLRMRDPEPFVISQEQVTQYLSPNNSDYTSSIIEIRERINNAVRSAGAVSSDRFGVLNRIFTPSDSAHVAMFVQADKMWRRQGIDSLKLTVQNASGGSATATDPGKFLLYNQL